MKASISISSIVKCAILFAVVLASGCVQFVAEKKPDVQVVFIKPSVPVMLNEELKDVSVMVKDKATGELRRAAADLFPGMWLIVDPEDFSTAKRAESINLRKE